MFTGTPEETLTLYHAEGDRWSATQVNGRGAPARFAETDASDPPAIQLGNTALEPGEGSLLGIGIVRLGEDACRVEWTFERGVRRFELRRLADLGRIQEELARLRAGIAGLQRQLDRHLKQEVEVRTGDEGGTRLLETRTLAPGPGWNESGVRLRKFVH
jgi:hypothetical protein